MLEKTGDCPMAVLSERPITAAAFGDIYDLSDGAKPIQAGGGHRDAASGDAWYSTWAGDDTAYAIMDDGRGFDNGDGLFARHRLCRLEGDPNISTDSFRGLNLNPGLLGQTIPHFESTPEWRIGYSSSVHEQDGVLYVFRHDWSPEKLLWPPINSSLLKSPDGGRSWINHLGQRNVLPAKEQAMFARLPWSWLTFIQYGKGGRVPDRDNCAKYVYLTAKEYLARIPRHKLADLRREDFEFYRGHGLDGLLDSSWSSDMNAGQPTSTVPIHNVVFNFALQRYVASGWSCYYAPGESGHDQGKIRLKILTAEHPWGPWQELLSYGIPGLAAWNFITCNKFTSADGKKMWHNFCGGYLGDLWNYGYQYMPLYLSTGQVDIYEAEHAVLSGLSVASSYPAFSGSGYVQGFSQPGDGATFALAGVRGTGWHIVRIRYTSPQRNKTTLSIYVNGKKARRIQLSLNDEGSMPAENWVDHGAIYYLNEGANTIALRQDEGDAATGVLLDCIAVSRERTFNEGRNVAPEAVATASSGEAALATKDCVDDQHEWSTECAPGQWIKLDWGASGRTIHRVVLYDRASLQDQVCSGTLSFSDDTSLKVGRLQNDGHAGTVVTFPPKSVQWVKYTVDAVRPGSQRLGLAEIQVFEKALKSLVFKT